MFTGIIEEIGTVKEITFQGSSRRIEIQAQKVLDDLAVDHSVAVNGVCLTIVERKQFGFTLDAVEETLSKTTLSQIKRGDQVNLERALRLQDRLGGHWVQGHVDGLGIIQQFNQQGQWSSMVIKIPQELQRYTVTKGSIAIDGVSLTIAEKQSNLIKVALIPHTMKQTIFQYKKPGDNVNIEVDFFAKYIEQFLNQSNQSKINEDWLKQQGF